MKRQFCPFFSRFPDGWYETKTEHLGHTYVKVELGLAVLWVAGEFGGSEPFLNDSDKEAVVLQARARGGKGAAFPIDGGGWRKHLFSWTFDVMVPLAPFNEWEGELELL